MFSRRRQDGYTRPLRCRRVAPGMRKAKAPTKGLSTLNSMAFGLAVYASQCGLPTPHARLASGRWSGATGRAFHPQGSDERFQSCFLTPRPPFPSFLAQSHRPTSLCHARRFAAAWSRHARLARQPMPTASSQALITSPAALAWRRRLVAACAISEIVRNLIARSEAVLIISVTAAARKARLAKRATS